jgi:hypothetical protein
MRKTTAGFVSRKAVVERAGNAALWRIFSLDRQTINKINIAAALRLPTFEADRFWPEVLYNFKLHLKIKD